MPVRELSQFHPMQANRGEQHRRQCHYNLHPARRTFGRESCRERTPGRAEEKPKDVKGSHDSALSNDLAQRTPQAVRWSELLGSLGPKSRMRLIIQSVKRIENWLKIYQNPLSLRVDTRFKERNTKRRNQRGGHCIGSRAEHIDTQWQFYSDRLFFGMPSDFNFVAAPGSKFTKDNKHFCKNIRCADILKENGVQSSSSLLERIFRGSDWKIGRDKNSPVAHVQPNVAVSGRRRRSGGPRC